MSPYVKNLWYVAAWEREVPAGGVLARRLLGEPWVLYRLASGDYALLGDRCAHRFAPLSAGERDGDILICPYHGLGYGADGRCVRNPFSDRPPQNAAVPRLPTMARDGLIWFWPGDPAAADAALVPDFSFMGGQSIRHGYSHFKAHFELLTDNLMELGHVEFVHRATFHPNGAAFRGRYEATGSDNGILGASWFLPGVNAPPFVAAMAPGDGAINQVLNMRWQAPACMALEISWCTGAAADQGTLLSLINPHIITPETNSSSHYFWTCDDHDAAEAMARRVFEQEDEKMIEAVQDRMGGEDFWALKPVNLAADAAGVRARQVLQRLRRAEQAPPGSPAP